MTDIDALAQHIDQPGVDGDPAKDIIHLAPDITQDEAFAVQLAVKQRQVARGDRIVGHQASFTSLAMRRIFPDAPFPMTGTLLASQMLNDGDEAPLDAETVFIESELGIVLKRDVEGPRVTRAEILASVEGFLPAIEVAPLRPGIMERAYSWAHLIACQKAPGGFVALGSKLTSPKGFDPRLEGCLISINGRPRAGAIGFEAMGDPLAVVAAMAAQLHVVGDRLRAGQILITGSLPPPQPVTASDDSATLNFRSLGSVSLHFATPGQA